MNLEEDKGEMAFMLKTNKNTFKFKISYKYPIEIIQRRTKPINAFGTLVTTQVFRRIHYKL